MSEYDRDLLISRMHESVLRAQIKRASDEQEKAEALRERLERFNEPPEDPSWLLI